MPKNEGEGNKTAARRYNKATTQFAQSGQVPAAARRAAEAVDGTEGKSLRDAERVGKAKAKKYGAER